MRPTSVPRTDPYNRPGSNLSGHDVAARKLTGKARHRVQGSPGRGIAEGLIPRKSIPGRCRRAGVQLTPRKIIQPEDHQIVSGARWVRTAHVTGGASGQTCSWRQPRRCFPRKGRSVLGSVQRQRWRGEQEERLGGAQAMSVMDSVC
eukprot:633734-Rhodomonas_salina.3